MNHTSDESPNADCQYWTRILSRESDGFTPIKGTEIPWASERQALVWAGAYIGAATDKTEIVECISAGHTVWIVEWIVEWIEGQEFPETYSEMREPGSY